MPRKIPASPSPPLNIEPGSSTAFPFNVEYRLSRVAKYLRGGLWLDYGCADGGYTASLIDHGATAAIGVDVIPERVEAASAAYPAIPFYLAQPGDGLPMFESESFDGIFMNEVLEHVADEADTLCDLRRILKPGGYLVVISPNRGFPFEGHSIRLGRWTSKRPTPLVPWLPRSLTDRWVTARNYWPLELRETISSAGFDITESGFIMPVFERYQWLPEFLSTSFRRYVSSLDHFPGIRRLGVSNLVVARRRNWTAASGSS